MQPDRRVGHQRCRSCAGPWRLQATPLRPMHSARFKRDVVGLSSILPVVIRDTSNRIIDESWQGV